MASGRVHALLIATRGAGQVVHERYYDSFSEPEKGEIRAAFDQVAVPLAVASPDGAELVGRFRHGHIVCIPSGDLTFFALGTGEYNPLVLAEVLRIIIGLYIELFKASSLTDTLLLSNYALTALVVNEVCREGLVELTDRPSVERAIALRLPFEAPSQPEKRGNFMASMLGGGKA